MNEAKIRLYKFLVGMGRMTREEYLAIVGVEYEPNNISGTN